MYNGKKILGVITARGGSKGLPGKNIRPLHGKPLLAWSIEAGKYSGILDELLVTTDDHEIGAIAREYGASVPFIRPPELATDTTQTMDVLLHVLEWYEQTGLFFDLLVLLQPTSPLRTAEDIVRGVKLLFEKYAQAVVSVCEAEHHPYWMNHLPEDGCMGNFLRKEAQNMPRQLLNTYYRLNGALYIAEITWLKEQKSFFGEKTFAYVMERERSVDIDEMMDFQLAEILLKNNCK